METLGNLIISRIHDRINDFNVVVKLNETLRFLKLKMIQALTNQTIRKDRTIIGNCKQHKMVL